MLDNPNIDIHSNDSILVWAIQNELIGATITLCAAGATTSKFEVHNPESLARGNFIYCEIIAAFQFADKSKLEALRSNGYTLNIKDAQGRSPIELVIYSDSSSEDDKLNVIKYIYAINPLYATYKNKSDQTVIEIAVGNDSGGLISRFLITAGYQKEATLLRQIKRQAIRQSKKQALEIIDHHLQKHTASIPN